MYDQHEYVDEMRAGLGAWAARLRSIVKPTAAAENVVALVPKRRARR